MKNDEDIQIDLNEASRLTGYSAGHIRNLVYAGELKRLSKTNNEKRSDGVHKRGQKIRLSKQEVLAKLGHNKAS